MKILYYQFDALDNFEVSLLLFHIPLGLDVIFSTFTDDASFLVATDISYSTSNVYVFRTKSLKPLFVTKF